MLEKQTVTVIGTGNAGLTAAYCLAKEGKEVCLYGAGGFDEQIDHIQSKGGITAINELNGAPLTFPGFAAIRKLTKDMREAVEYADILLLPVPSFAQEVLFRSMLPYLRDGQVIVLMPGNYGSLILHQVKISEGYEKLAITFVDAISIPWACRIVGEAEIAIFGRKNYLPMACFPSATADDVLPEVEKTLQIPISKLDNVIQAGLENINFGAHPLLTILNIGILENFNGDFNYYRDCCSTAVANAAAVLDIERQSVGKSLGIHLKPELEAMNDLYGTSYKSVYEFNRNSATHVSIDGAPGSSQHRYITEDVPYLFVPCLEFAELTKVDTPVMRAAIQFANAFNGVDYTVEGRTLEKMGLKGLSVNQIRQFVSS